ncbi:hypothetical protein G9A89_000691 [Geosiphon pyriformis]|nr:hypothetical protein G9A89_000691 [Geosiphon pyriformis]
MVGVCLHGWMLTMGPSIWSLGSGDTWPGYTFNTQGLLSILRVLSMLGDLVRDPLWLWASLYLVGDGSIALLVLMTIGRASAEIGEGIKLWYPYPPQIPPTPPTYPLETEQLVRMVSNKLPCDRYAL